VMPLGRNLVHEIADGSFHVAGKFDRQSPFTAEVSPGPIPSVAAPQFAFVEPGPPLAICQRRPFCPSRTAGNDIPKRAFRVNGWPLAAPQLPLPRSIAVDGMFAHRR